MSFFDKLKEVFLGKGQKMLSSGTEENNKVQYDNNNYIEINTAIINKIISDKDNYLIKFKNFDTHENIFGKGITKQNYVDAIIAYANHMINKGFIFPKNELKNIKEITGQSFKNKRFPQKSEHYKNQHIFTTCIDILRSTEKTNMWLDMNDEYQDKETCKKQFVEQFGYSKSVLAGMFKAIQKEQQLIQTNNGISLYIEEFNNFNYKKIKEVGYHSYRVTPDKYDINSELEKAVMKKIPKDLDDISFARAVYIELGKLLDYDYTVIYYNQSAFSEEVRKIYHKNPKDVSLQENDVICSVFSKLYAHILAKRGIRAHINGTTELIYGHRYVTLIGDNYIIKADATNGFNDGVTYMNDFDRLKFNIQPAGFEVIDSEGHTINLDDIDKNLGYTFDEFYYSGLEQGDGNLNELMVLLENENENLSEDIFDLQNDSPPVRVTKKLKFLIHEVMKNHPNLENSVMRSYLNNARYRMFTEEEKEYIELYDCYLKYNKETQKEHDYTPCIVVNIGTLENEKLKYLIYDRKKGFMHISEKTLFNDYEEELTPMIVDRSLFPSDYSDSQIQQEVEKYYARRIQGGEDMIFETR